MTLERLDDKVDRLQLPHDPSAGKRKRLPLSADDIYVSWDIHMYVICQTCACLLTHGYGMSV